MLDFCEKESVKEVKKMKNLKLVGYRNMCGCSQKKFAQLIGMQSAQAYGQKETGKKPFRINEMRILKEHINETLGLNLTVDEIFL